MKSWKRLFLYFVGGYILLLLLSFVLTGIVIKEENWHKKMPIAKLNEPVKVNHQFEEPGHYYHVLQIYPNGNGGHEAYSKSVCTIRNDQGKSVQIENQRYFQVAEAGIYQFDCVITEVSLCTGDECDESIQLEKVDLLIRKESPVSTLSKFSDILGRILFAPFFYLLTKMTA